MRMFEWFFTDSTNPTTPPNRLNLHPITYSDEVLGKLSNRESLGNGESLQVSFNYFDFNTPELKPLLKTVHPNDVFSNAIFAVDDIRLLLCNRFDLTQSSYVVNDVSFEHYEKCYDLATINQLPLTGLHGLRVDFSQRDLTGYPIEFVTSCTPVSLRQTRLSQTQFDLLLCKTRDEKHPIRQLDLSGLILAGINISRLASTYNLMTTLDRGFSDERNSIILLSNTSVQHAIIGLPELVNMTKNPKYYEWFSNDDLQFTLLYSNADESTPRTFDIDAKKFHAAIATFNPSPQSSARFFKDKITFLEQLKNLFSIILDRSPSTSPLSESESPKSEIFLSALACALLLSHNPVGRLFWETQGVTTWDRRGLPLPESAETAAKFS